MFLRISLNGWAIESWCFHKLLFVFTTKSTQNFDNQKKLLNCLGHSSRKLCIHQNVMETKIYILDLFVGVLVTAS
jgi:hypothetical protein